MDRELADVFSSNHPTVFKRDMANKLIESHEHLLKDYLTFGLGGELREQLIIKDKTSLVTDLQVHSANIISRTSIVEQDKKSKLVISKHGYIRLRPNMNLFLFIYNRVVFEVTVDPSFFEKMQPDDFFDSHILNWEFITRLDIILDTIVNKYHERYDNHCIKQWEFY